MNLLRNNMTEFSGATEERRMNVQVGNTDTQRRQLMNLIIREVGGGKDGGKGGKREANWQVGRKERKGGRKE